MSAQVNVAIVHDYLTQYGGAERVVEALIEHFPGSPVFTSLLDADALPATIRNADIRTTPLQLIPGGAHHHRVLLPLYPPSFRWLKRQLKPYDLIVASSSAWAHHAPVSEAATLICYCHSPARFLYNDAGYLAPSGFPKFAAAIGPVLTPSLRRLDQRAVKRIDRILANSANVARRIEKNWGRDSTIVYPPVAVERYGPATAIEIEDWFLVVTRLVPHKRIDLAIQAVDLANRRLKIVGSGRAEEALRRMAGPNIEFHGDLSDDAVARMMSRCKALIIASEEDFGITAVEAQAAGRPVIAYGRGGALETVIPGHTGVHFSSQNPESLATAIALVESKSWDPELAIKNAGRFSAATFHASLAEEIAIAAATR